MRALVEPDIGLLFHLGVNGQILMHFAAFHQIPWADYLRLMREGIARHGPVREGVYAMTGYEGVERTQLGRPRRPGRRREPLMPLVFAGVCSHAPGITGRSEQADPASATPSTTPSTRCEPRSRPPAPTPSSSSRPSTSPTSSWTTCRQLAIGMADRYDGPIEDPAWLRIDRVQVPGNRDLSQRFITEVMQTLRRVLRRGVALRPRDHGAAHFLTPRYDLPVIPVNINCQGPPLAPLHRAWAFGESLRAATDALPERIAMIGTGGISHWPATPDSGKINEAWDRDFLDRWCRNDRDALLDYDDLAVYADAGQGGFEIRTFLAVSAAASRRQGHGPLLRADPDLRRRLHHRHLRPVRSLTISSPGARCELALDQPLGGFSSGPSATRGCE